MSTSTARTVRCPACTAAVRTGSEWCTLCYTDLRPGPTRREAPLDAVPRQEPTSQPVAGPPEMESSAPVPRRRGKHARRDPAYDGGASRPDDVEAMADRLLSQLVAAEARHPLGALAGAVDSTAKRAVLMVGGSVAAMVLLFILMAIFGAFL